MNLLMIGCSHHNASVEIRERLAFSPDQTRQALEGLRHLYPESESVLLSTCNRTELYLASTDADNSPSHRDMAGFLAEFHGLNPSEVFDQLFERSGVDAIKHLFMVASSLDSMVVGEAQIISQVKQAYELAQEGDSAGVLLHSAFQAACRVAKRVTTETRVQERRVSIPSVAVADYAKQMFERFDDKRVLVIGAGEMAEETIRYLLDEGAEDITIVNRTLAHAEQLAEATNGSAAPWEELDELLAECDIVVSTTGATQPIVTAERFGKLSERRHQRMLFVLDLAVPRDFDPAIGDFVNVYLYSVDDLAAVCEQNRQAREREWPKAEKLIEEETARFMTELNHRATGPTIRRLTARANDVKADELERLMNKVGDVDDATRREIERFADRLVNKLLHPPLESLRDEAQHGAPHGLIEALRKLFQLKD
ncbi:MAG: glutamyl-tRNA reductase [Pirellulaceae bacterium]|jgi:glutamyl-tRNA reductase|nr:glutamyl-tRNA reductase [Pirellulaceae bacterium]MDP7018412.1 glutamyl-tRNA reductase [Pirellulaceae bacterium]